MYIFDRYVLRLFIKVLLISFISLTGLFIIVDAFGNLEEFISYGETEGGVLTVLAEYYGPRVLMFFDRTSALLALIAAMFALTWLQRTNELTAVMAAGISKARVVKPLIGAAIVVCLLGVINRELLIPNERDKLVRNAQDWLGQRQKPLRPQFDHQTNILLGGRHTIAAERKIIDPSFRLFTSWGKFGRQLIADHAVYLPPTDDRPGGYLLSGVSVPEDLSLCPSAHNNDEKKSPVILSPCDTDWLEHDQCFVASHVTFAIISSGPMWRSYSSLVELFSDLRNPSLDFGAADRVAVHARLLRPLLDMTLLLLGLPLALSKENRNMFVAGGLCLAIVAVFFIVVLASHALGGSGLISPALAAWCPLIIFVPLAVALSNPLWE